MVLLPPKSYYLGGILMKKAFVILSFFSIFLITEVVLASTPIGYIDQVVKEGSSWKVKGWACEPYLGQAIKVQLYLNNLAVGTSIFTNKSAELDVHSACGTNANLGIKYRFVISVPTGTPLSGQSVKVNATSPGGVASLTHSNVMGLPSSNVTPDQILAAASRIMLVVAHQDDEIVFSPFLGRYCASKTCIVLTTLNGAASNSQWASEWAASMLKFPVLVGNYEAGGFSSPAPNENPSTVLLRWESEAVANGLISLNKILADKIDLFRPNVILTFDPRHGTSCHAAHRATGEAVRRGVAAYSGTTAFDKTNLFFLTTRRIDGIADSGLSYMGLTPIAPQDRNSVVYAANDYISSSKGTGWGFLQTLLNIYKTQFTTAQANSVVNTDELERTTAFQRVTHYNANDTRYVNAYLRDPRFVACPSW